MIEFAFAVAAVLVLLWLLTLTMKVRKAMNELERLRSEVAETETAVESATKLIEGLAAQIRANANDPVALGELANRLDSAGSKLAAAVAANTPADDEVTDETELDPIEDEEPTGGLGGESGGGAGGEGGTAGEGQQGGGTATGGEGTGGEGGQEQGGTQGE